MTCFYDWIQKNYKEIRHREINKMALNVGGYPNNEELTQKEKDIINKFKEFRKKELKNESLHLTTR